ncbi:MAG TPA: lysylphosphatidylglycerol synthase domain-containing protein [Pyrinomonadaceae bacterium]|nr:lysylphosphatidylglycerol synthase domain-containing protein [Pyrinomonadaceae bacterium]
MSQKEQPAGGRVSAAWVLFAVAGLALFAYFVWKAGPAEIWANISRLGAGFLLVVLLGGMRFGVRAGAWTLCVEPPHRLGVFEAFKAFLVGDTAGNVVPLGLVVSEPTKAAYVRERLAAEPTLGSLAVENIFYMLSVALFMLSGAGALLLSFPLPKVLRGASIGVVVGTVLFLLFALFALRRQWKFLTWALEHAGRRGLGRKALERRRARVAALEDRVYGFYERSRSRFLPILLLESSFHLLGVTEAYLTLSLISDLVPTPLQAFLFESVNRVINVVFKFVPLRAGIDELGTGQLARVLAFGTAAGVTLAVVRKARMVVWMGVGVSLLVARGLSIRKVAAEAAAARGAERKEPVASSR